jgi:hypothetical protein
VAGTAPATVALTLMNVPDFVVVVAGGDEESGRLVLVSYATLSVVVVEDWLKLWSPEYCAETV